MSYKVKLESFEGPLDLLLFLIKKNEVDIYDIPVGHITQQFLEYIEIIKLLDIEAASDFILIAATLMRIKAKMLLPSNPEEAEEDEIEDPRQELVYRLLEYKRFKDVAVDLAEKEDYARKLYSRGSFKIEINPLADDIIANSDVTLFDLVAAFKKVVETNENKITVHKVQEVNVTLEERVEYVTKVITEKKEMKFAELFSPKDTKLVWIVSFIALLELIRNKVVYAAQEETFGDIILKKIEA